MLTKNEILKYLSKNKELFKQNFNIIRIGLFGSFARDEQTENSDIDIIIEMETDTQQF
jgi:predicted nucleotidyltransferase